LVNGSVQPAQTPTDPTLAGRTVLVIEDHKDSRELLTQVLQSLRAHVLTARTLEEAERSLIFHRPHLIVCDMRLPDGTGLNFIVWLRRQPKVASKIPCIAITGYEQQFPVDVAHGFDAYMRKPINLDKFCTVAVALARR
jgi:CheY-like chemotaxis protein